MSAHVLSADVCERLWHEEFGERHSAMNGTVNFARRVGWTRYGRVN